ncbi:MAG: UDP-N-acetylmuramoyl-tripeptide--D-alanyl-D-alanine ligase [Holosporales bacterium]|jgi:UDP-N-acetylmuramoyl-tripeptide--D-alanyl-D-alanine ligase|nr:UDP-N-acetylmuramoyl-tripeptide--D-alanyl-D-alanine ligase [Holosporales bacterium]
MILTKEDLFLILKTNSIPDYNFENISIDSRTIKKDNIFIALKGNNQDGNQFAKEALDKGASIAIIDNKDCFIDERTILVLDSLETLKVIGNYVKLKISPKKIIAITGSLGKTTIKSWLNQILNNEFSAFASIKNYNTIYGLPISLSLMPSNTDFGIFELGTNSPGEILELSEYLVADIGVITNIYESHIGRLGSKEALAKEKISIIDGLKPNSYLIYDGDSEFQDMIKNEVQSKNIKSISVGFNNNCDFYIKEYTKNIILQTPVGELKYNIAINAKHFAYISAVVIAVLYATDCDIYKLLQYFKSLTALSGRGQTEEFFYNNKKIAVIDDSYNASPTSVLAAIDMLQSNANLPKIAVIGQMKELGCFEEYYHKIVAEKLSESNLDFIFFIGERKLWKIFSNICIKNITFFEELNNFTIEQILQIMETGSIVLLKGSRCIGLEKFINYLKHVK